MEDRESTELTSRQAEYRGYVISSTALTNWRGQWVPCVSITLRGRRIGLSREHPEQAQLTGRVFLPGAGQYVSSVPDSVRAFLTAREASAPPVAPLRERRAASQAGVQQIRS